MTGMKAQLLLAVDARLLLLAFAQAQRARAIEAEREGEEAHESRQDAEDREAPTQSGAEKARWNAFEHSSAGEMFRQILALAMAVLCALGLMLAGRFVRRRVSYEIITARYSSYLRLASRALIISMMALGVAPHVTPPVEAHSAVLGTFYYHGNHLGSSSLVTDVSGNVVETAVYKPFGEFYQRTGVPGGNHYFTGQERDEESGLYYYGARYYNPEIGRFISADEFVQDAFDPQTLNRYSYTRNNPLIYTDPSGNIFGAILGFIITAFTASTVAGFAFGAISTTAALLMAKNTKEAVGGLFGGLAGMLTVRHWDKLRGPLISALIAVAVVGISTLSGGSFAPIVAAHGFWAVAGTAAFSAASSSALLQTGEGRQTLSKMAVWMHEHLGMSPKIAGIFVSVVSTAVLSSLLYMGTAHFTMKPVANHSTKELLVKKSSNLKQSIGETTPGGGMLADMPNAHLVAGERVGIGSVEAYADTPILNDIFDAGNIRHTAVAVDTPYGFFDSGALNLRNPTYVLFGNSQQAAYNISTLGAGPFRAFAIVARETGWSFLLTSAIYGPQGGGSFIVGTAHYHYQRSE
jgi:RHS repeat-associated protein